MVLGRLCCYQVLFLTHHACACAACLFAFGSKASHGICSKSRPTDAIRRGGKSLQMKNAPGANTPPGGPQVVVFLGGCNSAIWLWVKIETQEAPGEHQNRWQMDVHPPQNGIAIGYPNSAIFQTIELPFSAAPFSRRRLDLTSVSPPPWGNSKSQGPGFEAK